MQLLSVHTLLLWCLIPGTSRAYSDVRLTPCMNQELLQSTKNRGTWAGGVEMTMKCDPGYDIPLNAPYGGRFRCEAGDRPWLPAYVPDCNKLQKPIDDEGFVVMSIKMSESECKAVSEQDGGSQIKLGPKTISPAAWCTPDTTMSGCTVHKVIPRCSGMLEKTNMTEENHWANEVGPKLEDTSFFVVVILKVRFNSDVARSLYVGLRKITQKLSAAATQGVDETSRTRNRLKPRCPAGMIGALAGENKEDRAVVCRGCSLGHKLDLASKKCTPCEHGYYQDKTLSTECKMCPALKKLKKDDKRWDSMDKHAPDRSYSIIFCPVLLSNGTLVSPQRKIGDRSSQLQSTSRFVQKLDRGGCAGLAPHLAPFALLLIVCWMLG